MKKYILFSLILILFSNIILGQEDITPTKISKKELSEEEKSIAIFYKNKNRHFNNYKKYAHEKLNMKNDKLIKYYHNHRINIKKIEELKGINVDLTKELNSFNNYSYIRGALVAPIVIEGVVTKRDYDKRPDVYFHTIYTIKVNNVISKGRLANIPNEIYVKNVEGLIEDQFVKLAHGYTLFIGETVLLFLDPLHHMSIQRDNLNFPRRGTQVYLGLDKYDLESSFTLRNRFSVKSKHIYGSEGGRVGLKNDIYSKIKKITEINNFQDFIKDFIKNK